MIQTEIRTAVLIGAGNLGWHLGHVLNEKGIRIVQVFSQSEPSGKELAALFHADFSTDLKRLAETAGIIIIAVPDINITDVIVRSDFRNNMVVHTAGSTNM